MDGQKWQLYFSTDDSINEREVLDYYRIRFQQEFCFRDNKQYAGITNCQSIDFRKLTFHFNTSHTTINLTKAACKRLRIPFSISSCKSVVHKAYMLERFISACGITPDLQVINKLFKELILRTIVQKKNSSYYFIFFVSSQRFSKIDLLCITTTISQLIILL